MDTAGRTMRRPRALSLAIGGGILAVVAVMLGWVALRGMPAADPDRLWQQARLDLVAGRHDQAADTLRRLATLREPTPLDRMLRAQVAMARERPEEAIEQLSTIPDDHPGAVQARLQVGQLELRRGRLRAAEESLLAAVALDPEGKKARNEVVKARRELVYIYGMQLRRDRLGEQFRALSKLSPLTFDEAFLWCLTRGSVWEPQEQADDLQRFLEADPTDRQSRLALADSLRRLLQFDRAEEVLAPLPDSDPDARAARVKLALDRGEDDRVEALLAEGPEDHAELAKLRGRRSVARGEPAESVRHYRRAVKADPDDRDALFALGQALQATGDPEDPAPYFERARKLNELATLVQRAAPERREARTDPELMRDLGAACEAVGRFAEAKAWYSLAIGINPLDAEAQRAIFRLNAALEGQA